MQKCRRLVADVEPSTAAPSEIILQDKKERIDVAFVISEYDAPLSPLSSICFVLVVICISFMPSFLQNYSTALPSDRDNLARVESGSTSKVAANVLENISASLERIEASVKNLEERTSTAEALDAVAKSLKTVKAKVLVRRNSNFITSR